MDPRRANGGVFLGLNGIVIKSHGGTDAEGFAAAIELGHGVVRDRASGQDHGGARRGPASGRAAGDRRSGLVTIRRSVILGCGSYLPSQVLTNERPRAQGRHVRRMDRAAHRHPRAPHRRARRTDLAYGGACGARRARARACRCAVDRSHRAGDLDAGQYVSGQRRRGAGRARHHPRRRVRSAGGVLRLRLRAGDGRRAAQDRRVLARAGDRRGDVFAPPRLDRSRAPACCSAMAPAPSCSMPRSSRAPARIAAS